MLGQLNASHMGLRGGENPKETQSQRTGLLGISGVNTSKGFKVAKVLPGSPADRSESKLLVGDLITSVNQEPVTESTNFLSVSLTTSEKL